MGSERSRWSSSIGIAAAAVLVVVLVAAFTLPTWQGVGAVGLAMVVVAIPLAIVASGLLQAGDDRRHTPAQGGRRRGLRSEAVAYVIALLPAGAALLFLRLAPSEGANIGGGLAVLASVPVGVALFAMLRPRDADGRPVRSGRGVLGDGHEQPG